MNIDHADRIFQLLLSQTNTGFSIADISAVLNEAPEDVEQTLIQMTTLKPDLITVYNRATVSYMVNNKVRDSAILFIKQGGFSELFRIKQAEENEKQERNYLEKENWKTSITYAKQANLQSWIAIIIALIAAIASIWPIIKDLLK